MKDLIYNQRNIPKNELRYGLRSSAATGCGWIATYNALRLLGYRVDKAALIRCFERQLPLIHGNLGTTIPGPAICFRRWGFDVRMEARPDRFDTLAAESDVCILFFHWRNKWKFGAHFVAVTQNGGEFIGYNTYRNSTGPDVLGPSLTRFLQKRRYFCPMLLGIRNNRK